MGVNIPPVMKSWFKRAPTFSKEMASDAFHSSS